MVKRGIGKWASWSVLAAVLLACLTLWLPAVARAEDGGSSIATAQELPLGTTFVGSAKKKDGYVYWLVTMAAGDKLTIDYQPINGGRVYLDFYEPGLTDFTIGDASPVVSAWSDGKTKYSWTSTGSGSWILKVRTGAGSGYQILATIRRANAAKITGLSPGAGRRGSTVAIIGRGFGASRGAGYITFGSAKVTQLVSWSATRITCRVPTSAKLGMVPVKVTTSTGTSNAKSFTVKQ